VRKPKSEDRNGDATDWWNAAPLIVFHHARETRARRCNRRCRRPSSTAPPAWPSCPRRSRPSAILGSGPAPESLAEADRRAQGGELRTFSFPSYSFPKKTRTAVDLGSRNRACQGSNRHSRQFSHRPKRGALRLIIGHYGNSDWHGRLLGISCVLIMRGEFEGGRMKDEGGTTRDTKREGKPPGEGRNGLPNGKRIGPPHRHFGRTPFRFKTPDACFGSRVYPASTAVATIACPCAEQYAYLYII
jgi:hypothetical protein